MTDEEYEDYLARTASFEKEVLKWVPLYVELHEHEHDVRIVKYLDTVKDVQPDCVVVVGDEYWKYGGYERHRVCIPRPFITSEAAREQARQAQKQRAVEREIAREQERVKREKEIREEARRLAEAVRELDARDEDENEDGGGDLNEGRVRS